MTIETQRLILVGATRESLLAELDGRDSLGDVIGFTVPRKLAAAVV